MRRSQTQSPIFQSRFRGLVQDSIWALRLPWTLYPSLTIRVIGLKIVNSVIPALQALAGRNLINAIVDMVNSGTGQSGLLLWFAANLLLLLTNVTTVQVLTYLRSQLADLLNIQISSDILKHLAALDLAYFEDPDTQNVIQRARNNGASRFMPFLDQILQVITDVIQVITLAAIVVVIEPLSILFLIPLAIPYALFQIYLSRLRYEKQYQRAEKYRWKNYFSHYLTSRQTIPEIKLLGLAPFLLSKFNALMVDFRNEDRSLYRYSLFGNLTFSGISMLVFYWLVVRVTLQAGDGSLTVGDVTVFAAIIMQLRGRVEGVIRTISGMLEQVLFISNLRDFFELSVEGETSPGEDLPSFTSGRIHIENLTFTYPGTSNAVLKDINLDIHDGEVVALVGKNGAGKTTLVNLIAGLYQPQEGHIVIDNVDIKSLSHDHLHQHLSFVFQQSNRYEATVEDNIAYGDWKILLGDSEKIRAIAKATGIDDLIMEMPEHYDTRLGRQFGEYDLSGGQWQKLAIARAFARDALILILDEPTSNLDAQAEYELFKHFKEIAQGRTTILISHRFSTVNIADRILVMSQGRIIERGTHQELLDLGGEYALLYQRWSTGR